MAELVRPQTALGSVGKHSLEARDARNAELAINRMLVNSAISGYLSRTQEKNGGEDSISAKVQKGEFRTLFPLGKNRPALDITQARRLAAERRQMRAVGYYLSSWDVAPSDALQMFQDLAKTPDRISDAIDLLRQSSSVEDFKTKAESRHLLESTG